jgi:biopolymer transport protein ExbB
VLAYNVFGKRAGACEAELEGFAHDLREMMIDHSRDAAVAAQA